MFLKIFFFALILNSVIGIFDTFLIDESLAASCSTEGIGCNVIQGPVLSPSSAFVQGQPINFTSSFDASIGEEIGDLSNQDNETTLLGGARNPSNDTTGDPFAGINDFFDDTFGHLNFQELQTFAKFIDFGFIGEKLGLLMIAMGVDFPAGTFEGFGVIIAFAGVIFVLYTIFGRSHSSFT
jgi:hypothetical protein